MRISHALLPVAAVSFLALDSCGDNSSIGADPLCSTATFDVEGRRVTTFGTTADARKVQAFLQATIDLDHAVNDVGAGMIGECRAIGTDLGLTNADYVPASSGELPVVTVCNRVIREVRTVIQAGLPSGARLDVQRDAARVPRRHQRRGAVRTPRCSGSVMVTAPRCKGTLVADCNGSCDAYVRGHLLGRLHGAVPGHLHGDVYGHLHRRLLGRLLADGRHRSLHRHLHRDLHRELLGGLHRELQRELLGGLHGLVHGSVPRHVYGLVVGALRGHLGRAVRRAVRRCVSRAHPGAGDVHARRRSRGGRHHGQRRGPGAPQHAHHLAPEPLPRLRALRAAARGARNADRPHLRHERAGRHARPPDA